MRKKLGELLVERGIIDREQLHEALSVQRRNGVRLGVALMRLGHLAEDALTQTLSDLLRVPTIDLEGLEPDLAAVDVVSARFAAEHDLFPVRLHREGGRTTLTVAMSDPTDVRALDELGFMTNARVEARLASPSDVDRAIRQVYGPRLSGRVPMAPLTLRKDGEAGRMTIVRRGGGEEEVDTGPLAERPEPPTADLPVVHAVGDDPEPPILLTEPVPRRSAPRGAGSRSLPPAPARGGASSRAAAPAHNGSSSGPRPPAADPGGLGALVDAGGQAIDAEAIVRLERRVWALLRVLSRKGFITKEEFVREMGDDA